MATILREVVTRYRFETDQKGVNKFNQTTRKMRGRLKGLGRLMGITLGVAGARAFFKMGQNANRAAFSLRRLVGTDFRPLRRTLRNIRAEMNSVRAGSGELIRTKDFDIAAAGFFRAFGRGRQQMKQFREMFAFASRQAAVTGQNVTEVFSALQAAVIGGDFSALLDLPGFDRFRQKVIEFQQQAIDPGEPGGRVALQNRMRVLTRIMTQAGGAQRKALAQVPAELIEADKAAASFQESMDKLAKVFTTQLLPAIQGLNKGLAIIAGWIDRMSKKDQIPPLLNLLIGKRRPPPPGRKKTPEPGGGDRDFFGGSNSGGFFGLGVATPGGQQISNTFHITSTDPAGAAKEVKRQFDRSVREAVDGLVRTEGR